MPPQSTDDAVRSLDHPDAALADRVDALAAWIQELDGELRASAVAGDAKTLKELRQALEAWAKHDPKLAERLTNRVDVLTDRLTTLAQTVNTTAAALAGREGELAALRRELETGYARIEPKTAEPRESVSAREVAELRAAVAALSSDRSAAGRSRKGDGRVDEVNAKLDVLAERLETVAKTAATTASGLAGREGEVALLRRNLEDGLASVEESVAELGASVDPASALEARKAVEDLSHETRALKRDRQRMLDAVTSKFETVTGRVDSLAAWASATAAALAAREGEVAKTRTELQSKISTIALAVAEVRDSMTVVSSKVAELETLEERAGNVDALVSRVEKLGAAVDGLATRVESATARAEETSTGIADHERELATLERRLDETTSHVDSMVAELRDTIDALPLTSPTEAANTARLEELTRRLESIPGELARVEAMITRTSTEGADERKGFEGRLADLATRFNSTERDREAFAAELSRASESWDEERKSLRDDLAEFTLELARIASLDRSDELEPLVGGVADRVDALERAARTTAAEAIRTAEEWATERARMDSRLDSLASSVASGARVAEELFPRLSDVGARLQALERDAETVAADVGRLAEASDTERESLQEQVQRLASDLAAAASRSDSESERRLTGLADRLESVERDGVVVASEIGRAAAFWASQLRELEIRIDETIRTREPGDPSRADVDHVVSGLADRVQGLERQREPALEEIARLGAEWKSEHASLAVRLDDLWARIDEVPSSSVSSTAASGDGRHRVGFRKLELRMDHAEAAARENREAVLVQLERLASRIEWRLQRLESERGDGEDELAEPPQGLGQVVPIHGEA